MHLLVGLEREFKFLVY